MAKKFQIGFASTAIDNLKIGKIDESGNYEEMANYRSISGGFTVEGDIKQFAQAIAEGDLQSDTRYSVDMVKQMVATLNEDDADDRLWEIGSIVMKALVSRVSSGDKQLYYTMKLAQATIDSIGDQMWY